MASTSITVPAPVQAIRQDSVLPTAEGATLPRPSDLARIGTFQREQSMTISGAPQTVENDSEKALKPTHSDVYDRFSPRRKSIINAIVSFAALLAREFI
jgi:hypothetical protein